MVDITQILVGVITIISALVSAFLIPWLKEKYGNEKLSRAYEIVNIAVEAAEQIFSGQGMGAEKKNYVMDYLASMGIKYDSETINNMIESAVKNLNNE